MAKLRNPEPVEETPEELTAREELEQFALVYQENDVEEKAAKKVKEGLRPALLELMSEVVRDEIPLETRTETVPVALLERVEYDVEKWAARNFPTWTVVGIQPGETEYQVVLQENDGLKKFEFSVGGFKFGRTTKMVDSEFRAAAFLEEVAKRKDLSRDLLGQLLKTVKSEIVTVYTFDEDAANAIMADNPETMAIFQEYMYLGKPQVTLLPIRPVKEEEE